VGSKSDVSTCFISSCELKNERMLILWYNDSFYFFKRYFIFITLKLYYKDTQPVIFFHHQTYKIFEPEKGYINDKDDRRHSSLI